MKNLNSQGCKISSVDQKALDHYLLVTPLKWSQDALAGMINKSIKSIMKAGFEEYKEIIGGNINPDYAVIIPGILAMDGFGLNKVPTPAPVIVNRKEAISNEIWAGGFDVEDYEDLALRAFYVDPEAMLDWFMENKIYQRRKALVKEKEVKFIKESKAFPANQDDFINFAVNEPGYKNRKDSEKMLI